MIFSLARLHHRGKTPRAILLREDTNLAGFDDIYFPDSYVLAVTTDGAVEFDLYVYPRGNAILSFPNVRSWRWHQHHMKPHTDPDGSVDYGTIDSLMFVDGAYRICGEWGDLEIESESPTIQWKDSQ